MDLLWPNFAESNARHSLSQVLTNLRTLVGDRSARQEAREPFLVTTSQSVSLNPHSDCRVDARTFASLVDNARVLRQSGSGNGEDLALLARAVTLYQGEFLAGFSLSDAYPYEEWLLLQRERLHRWAVETLNHLTKAYCQAGDYAAALPYAWRWVAMDPWQEKSQRRLIRLLALSGQRTMALRQYEICCRALQEEVGVEPEPETVALYQRVRNGDLVGSREVSAGPLPSKISAKRNPIHNLPAQLVALVGREEELALLGERLADPACRLVTLIGPGGIGKTRLGLEVAWQQLASFEDGVFLVSLAPVPSVEGIASAVAQAIGLPISERASPPWQQLLDYLRSKSVLLVLDNMEHLLDGTALVTALLAGAPGSKALVTSRARLNALSETVVRVAPLALPEASDQPGIAAAAADAAAVADAGAVRLFVQSAQRVLRGFRLSPETTPVVVEICRQVGGVPLAILLAAAWIDVLSVSEIRDRLVGDPGPNEVRSFDFLRAAWSDVPDRQRSMRAVFDQSWQLLGERDRAMMGVLAIFHGAFSAGAAYYVAGATLHDLRRLVDQSMLAMAGNSRYEMHALLRAYAQAYLDRVPAASCEARERHAAYYMNVLQSWAQAARGPRQQEALVEMDAEIADARAAWLWAVEQGDAARIGDGIDGLHLYYERRVRREEAGSACEAALAQFETPEFSASPPSPDRLRALARALIWRSDMLLGKPAHEAVDHALDILSSPDLESETVRSEMASALLRKGHLLMASDRDQARVLYLEGLALCRETGDRWLEARALESLSARAQSLGEYEEAQQWSEATLNAARSLGDLRAMSWGVFGLSAVLAMRGQLEAATRLAEESLALCRELGDPVSVADGLYWLGNKWLFAGRVADAIGLYEECAGLMDNLGLPHPIPDGVKAWGSMLAGQYDDARELVADAMASAEELNHTRAMGWTYYVRGCLELVDGVYDQAVAWFEKSASVFRPLGERLYLAIATSGLGYAYWAIGQLDRAFAAFAEASRAGLAMGSPAPLVFSLPGVALLYAQVGQVARAIEMRTAVSQYYGFIAASRWYRDVAGPAYDLSASTLCSDAATAAERRGLVSDVMDQAKAILDAGWPVTA